METFNIKMARISTKIVEMEIEAECQELAEEKAYDKAASIDFTDAEDCGVEYEIYTVDGEFPDDRRY